MKKDKTKAIGIDLGTTNTEMCGINAAGEAKYIKNAEGKFITESVVYFPPKGEPVVGTVAANSGMLDPRNCVRQVKRLMGKRDAEGKRIICYSSRDGKQHYTPVDISATILRKIKKDAETILGSAITHAVITVPAYFDDNAKRDTREAGEQAGLTVLQLISEPTAAALAYGLDKKGDTIVMVCDLGGGTFDVCVLEIKNGQVRVIAVDGDSNLGGEDWTMLIVKRVMDEAARAGIKIDPAADPVICAEIREKAEIAKQNLSCMAETVISVNIKGQQVVVKYSLADFERDSAALLGRMEPIIKNVIKAAAMPVSALDEIALVGGATRMGMITTLVKKVTQKDPKRDADPEMIIAMGAALAAAQFLKEKGEKVYAIDGTTEVKSIPDCKFRDVAAHDLGVASFVSGSEERTFVPIIKKNTPVPAKCSEKFSFKTPDQTGALVEVYQGHEGMTLSQCLHIADVQLANLPKSSSPDEIRIEATYENDASGIVHVTVKDLKSGKSISSDLVHDITKA